MNISYGRKKRSEIKKSVYNNFRITKKKSTLRIADTCYLENGKEREISSVLISKPCTFYMFARRVHKTYIITTMLGYEICAPLPPVYWKYTKSEREHIASCAIFPLRSRSRTKKKQTNLMHFMYIHTNTHTQREERQRAKWSGNQRGWKRSERKKL